MKKFPRSPLILLVASLCIIIVILYFLGFRITYAPNLENSWNAISTCASWFSAIMSAAAIFVAISIPKKIAEQQDKISLFEKRYSAFDSFVFLTSAIKQIIDTNVDCKNYMVYFDNMIETYNSVSIIREYLSDCKDPYNVYIRLIFEAGKIQYLFNLEEMEIIIDFLLATDQFISDVYKGKSVDATDLKTIYTKLICENIQEKLEKQLKI